MHVESDCYIDGEFSGWDGDQFFRLTNGEMWQQAHYKYHHHYAYRPRARIVVDGGRHFLEVAGMPDRIEVRRAPSIIFIYAASGQPVGFWHHRYVYTLQGHPVGYLSGDHVYKLSGQYVGELNKYMIVDKHLSVSSVSALAQPAHLAAPASPAWRSPMTYGYQDVFRRLLD